MPATGAPVGLVQFTAAVTGRFTPQRVGLDHLCFAVATRQEMLSRIGRPDEFGVAHSAVQEMQTGPTVNFADPDGIELSFALPPPESQ